MFFPQLTADFYCIKANNPLLPLQKILKVDQALTLEDTKIFASIGRITAVACGSAVFFVSSSWVTCGIVWILSRDLYRMANYLHDGKQSPWITACNVLNTCASFGVKAVATLVTGEGTPTVQESARKVFWDNIKTNLISFKIYNAIKKQLS